MPIDRGNVRGLVRAVAYDAAGSRLGRVAQVFIDDRTDEPAWVAVDVTRTRGMRLLPLSGASLKGRYLVIRADRRTVRSAPRIDLGDGQLSSQDESRLLDHYGLTPSAGDQPQTADQRPASPWPDDNERETAWERPTQYGEMNQDTQALSHGWEQPIAGSPPAQQQGTDQSAAGRPSWDPPPASDQTVPQSTVGQPVASPVAAHPVADKPVAAQPVTDKQIAAQQPVGDKPTANWPVAARPVAAAPIVDRPAADQPTSSSGEIGDRGGAIRDRGLAAAEPDSASGLSRDTAPTPVTPAPSPPAAPQADPKSEDSSSAPPTR